MSALPDAILSDDRRYRYLLKRDLDTLLEGGRKVCAFVMLNPSTADEIENDRTIQKCIGFARRWGCATLYVVNLSPLRATNPRELLRAGPEPAAVQEKNRCWQRYAMDRANIIVAAWGNDGGAEDRERRALADFKARGIRLFALGLTKLGHPRHPLYLGYNTPLEVWDY